MKKFICFLAAILILYSCKKDTKPSQPVSTQPTLAPATVVVSFNGVVDSLPLVYGNNYKNAYGDTFKVSKFKYFITNVVLTASDGSKYYEVESYHLMDHSSTGNTSFTISNVTPATYKSISYMIGVDSARNVSGVQENDLRPSLDMYWSWTEGYIMLKFEGSSPQAGSLDKSLTFHMGGFAYPYTVIKKCSLVFGQDLIVANGKSPQLKLKTNVNELFKNPNTYDFHSTYDITSPGMRANGFSNNYVDMITFESIVP